MGKTGFEPAVAIVILWGLYCAGKSNVFLIPKGCTSFCASLYFLMKNNYIFHRYKSKKSIYFLLLFVQMVKFTFRYNSK